MIHLYPANKMENLLVLLDKVHQVAPLPVFSKEYIIVQNAGMQHWLNMSLATRRNLSMNNQFMLPAQFLWQMMRSLASKEKVPEQSPYSREALCWRIYSILAQPIVTNDERYQTVNRYWNNSLYNQEKRELHRYQLACQLADLYEQYLIYRPQWIDAWYKGEHLAGDSEFQSLASWQGALWLKLTEQAPYNPKTMMESAIANMAEFQQFIPERITFFGINAMAPMWLSFIHELSQFSQVHFFHLNPCFDYWGEIKTQKQAANLVSQWTDNLDEFSELIGNPLLANLGQQGREFLALLQQYSTIDIEVFDDFSAGFEKTSAQKNSVLELVQQDILTLNNRSLNAQPLIDESIVFTSAHSPLREVQGLHDWLLHQFNHDPSLTPKDILVMCPQVEEYAPYVQAVFAQGWHDLSRKLPPLPCSISDRISKDSDPIVATFLEFLALPDNRFNVTKIIAWLNIPVIKEKYRFSDEDIDKCCHWLKAACVHWGIDQQQKQQILDTNNASNMYTWQFGFSKLLQGFAYQDENVLFQDSVLLADVEGSDAIVLGQLMLFIEHLQWFAKQMSQHRTPSQWHEFLTTLSQQLLVSASFPDIQNINSVLDSFVEYCHHGAFEEKISLSVINDFLHSHFSVADAGRQFMVGQVTFCSMLPMRSIPFKIIAILGLNDGDYPRQRQPFGFDLMSVSPSKLGDRSRRGDDKYLFLEAIISARQSLYLSYQGRSIKNNAVREPSLVLKELMSYLTKGFGWEFSPNLDAVSSTNCLRQLAMQPYSVRNFVQSFPGFDSRWLALGKQISNLKDDSKAKQTELFMPLAQETLMVSLEDLLNFYQNPARYFAKNQLNLVLDNKQNYLEDNEPFVIDYLDSYQLADTFLNENLVVNENKIGLAIEHEKLIAMLSGRLPELPTTKAQVDKLASDSERLASVIKTHVGNNFQTVPVIFESHLVLPCFDKNSIAESQEFKVVIQATLPVCDQRIVLARPTSAKAKDKLKLYLSHLLTQCLKESGSGLEMPISTCEGFYFNTKAQKVNHFRVEEVEQPREALNALLSHYIEGIHSPKPYYAGIAETMLKAKSFEQAQLDSLWHDERSVYQLDPYLRYFWPESPKLEHLQPILFSLFEPVFSKVKEVKSS
ncbi:exodeoxyribonuclease V subunit gamma [Thalassotalea ganghwensis]